MKEQIVEPDGTLVATESGAPMILFVILGHVPLILLACLIGLLWLTWVELRGEDLQPMVKLWWGLLVLLTHVLGYVALRIWLAYRRAGQRRPA